MSSGKRQLHVVKMVVLAIDEAIENGEVDSESIAKSALQYGASIGLTESEVQESLMMFQSLVKSVQDEA